MAILYMGWTLGSFLRIIMIFNVILCSVLALYSLREDKLVWSCFLSLMLLVLLKDPVTLDCLISSYLTTADVDQSLNPPACRITHMQVGGVRPGCWCDFEAQQGPSCASGSEGN